MGHSLIPVLSQAYSNWYLNEPNNKVPPETKAALYGAGLQWIDVRTDHSCCILCEYQPENIS